MALISICALSIVMTGDVASASIQSGTVSTTDYFHAGGCGGVIKKMVFMRGSVSNGSSKNCGCTGSKTTDTYYCSACNAAVGGAGTCSCGANGGWGVEDHTCYFCAKCCASKLTTSNWTTAFTYRIVFNKNY